MTFWHAMQCLPLTNWIVFYPIKGRATGTLANPYSPTTADRVTYTVYAADCMHLFTGSRCIIRTSQSISRSRQINQGFSIGIPHGSGIPRKSLFSPLENSIHFRKKITPCGICAYMIFRVQVSGTGATARHIPAFRRPYCRFKHIPPPIHQSRPASGRNYPFGIHCCFTESIQKTLH